MILALAATLAIVVQDHTLLRASPGAGGTVLTALSQGDTLEVRGDRVGYLKVYDYRRERGGYVRNDMVREMDLSEASAPELLAVLRFLRDSPGSEALGISYGAAYLKAAPAGTVTAEAIDAIARMAERLADAASSNTGHATEAAAHIETVQQFGIRMHSVERNGRMQVCYDGELYHRVLSQRDAGAEARAYAVLGLTRPDCMDPDWSPRTRDAFDQERCDLLEQIDATQLSPMTASRIHSRRAAVWASIAFEQARRGEPAGPAGMRASGELLSVHADELGDDRRAEYLDALLRVGAIRWAQETPVAQTGPLTLTADAGAAPGQTCVSVHDARRRVEAAALRRCTYGIVWMASVRALPQTEALVLAVQPLDGWRELWVFHEKLGAWLVDVLSPGSDDPDLGYIEFAGFAADTRRLLVAREVRVQGRTQRRFEELRLDDLTVMRQASTPDFLRDFGRWQDLAWRRSSTLTLH